MAINVIDMWQKFLEEAARCPPNSCICMGVRAMWPKKWPAREELLCILAKLRDLKTWSCVYANHEFEGQWYELAQANSLEFEGRRMCIKVMDGCCLFVYMHEGSDPEDETEIMQRAVRLLGLDTKKMCCKVVYT